MQDQVQIGDQYTNGRETLTITEINASGRVRYFFDWQENGINPNQNWKSMNPILKHYRKVEK